MPEPIAVLGLGNWGTALAQHLANKGFDVIGWSIEDRVVAGINSENRNPIYLKDHLLNTKIRATKDITPCLEVKHVVMVVASTALVQVVPQLKFRQRPILISAIKGIDAQTLLTPLQLAEKHLSAPADLAVISGPSFARDIVARRPAGIVAASKSEEVARTVAELFSSESLKLYISTDPLGVELGGIVKNVIALAAGVSDGLSLGDSARAGLITRGLAEMMRLVEAMGGDVRTLSGLSGLGDLVMTSSSPLSRNRTVGFKLGQGEKLSDILSSLGSVAEGVTTTPLVLSLARKFNVEMPITEAVEKLLSGTISPELMAKGLMSRPLKKEFK